MTEAIRMSFDPAVISRREILELFFAFHDPTTLNRQGPMITPKMAKLRSRYAGRLR
jgi:peptide methionine sulfoxide reductase MsrA